MSQRLPNGGCALVEEKKVVEYLLNLAHPDGTSKAKFFLARGFDFRRWGEMRDADPPADARYAQAGPESQQDGQQGDGGGQDDGGCGQDHVGSPPVR